MLIFDVVVRNSGMVVVAVITDHEGVILFATARRLPFIDVNAGEATTALLAIEVVATFYSSSPILIEGDSLLTILALNSPSLDVEWSSVGIIADTISFFFCFSILVYNQGFKEY